MKDIFELFVLSHNLLDKYKQSPFCEAGSRKPQMDAMMKMKKLTIVGLEAAGKILKPCPCYVFLS